MLINEKEREQAYMYPMKLIPSFKDYIWGGERLINEYGKDTALRPVAESWEISCHPDGPSVAIDGDFARITLAQVLSLHPEYMGTKWVGITELPILVKFIDAKQDLSLQVHPDDAYAQKHENQSGKNEFWYVMDAERDATLVLGFSTPISVEEMGQRISNDTLLEVCNIVAVQAGDCFEVPAGMLHAIGKGILIVEIQQSSNVTYRVYDYGRLDTNGKARSLHISQALDVINTSLVSHNQAKVTNVKSAEGFHREILTQWTYFSVQRLTIQSHANLFCDTQSFHALTCIKGNMKLHWSSREYSLDKGDSMFLPAGLGSYLLKGDGTVLLTTM